MWIPRCTRMCNMFREIELLLTHSLSLPDTAHGNDVTEHMCYFRYLTKTSLQWSCLIHRPKIMSDGSCQSSLLFICFKVTRTKLEPESIYYRAQFWFIETPTLLYLQFEYSLQRSDDSPCKWLLCEVWQRSPSYTFFFSTVRGLFRNMLPRST